MPHFVKNPNLPGGQVSVIAVGEDYSKEISEALLPFGIRVLSCPNNPLVDARLRSHIDLSVFHLGDNKFVLSDAVSDSSFAEELNRMGAEIVVSAKNHSSEYPNDAFLCALSNGNRLFHNKSICDPIIRDYLLNRIIHVNQGYAKCAVCLVNETTAITSDAGLTKAMEREGIEVLKIASVGITLSGFDEGFIGGASFKIAPNKLAFSGVLNDHPNKAEIEIFVELHGITPVYLTDKPIFDIGSFIPILEL